MMSSQLERHVAVRVPAASPAGVHDDPPAKREQAMRFAVNLATYAVTN